MYYDKLHQTVPKLYQPILRILGILQNYGHFNYFPQINRHVFFLFIGLLMHWHCSTLLNDTSDKCTQVFQRKMVKN